MQHNPDLPNNHISKLSSMESKKLISYRFQLLERCIKLDIPITDELLELVETDKNLLTFNGRVSSFEHRLKPISRNTVNNHGMLNSLQEMRKQARRALNEKRAIENNQALSEQLATENSQAPNQQKKETKASLKADRDRLNLENNQLTSELASLRSAYRELLREVNAKLPLDEKVKKIVEVHNKNSVIRSTGPLRIVK
jgi:predicted nuclease with TOPRIM domain